MSSQKFDKSFSSSYIGHSLREIDEVVKKELAQAKKDLPEAIKKAEEAEVILKKLKIEEEKATAKKVEVEKAETEKAEAKKAKAEKAIKKAKDNQERIQFFQQLTDLLPSIRELIPLVDQGNVPGKLQAFSYALTFTTVNNQISKLIEIFNKINLDHPSFYNLLNTIFNLFAQSPKKFEDCFSFLAEPEKLINLELSIFGKGFNFKNQLGVSVYDPKLAIEKKSKYYYGLSSIEGEGIIDFQVHYERKSMYILWVFLKLLFPEVKIDGFLDFLSEYQSSADFVNSDDYFMLTNLKIKSYKKALLNLETELSAFKVEAEKEQKVQNLEKITSSLIVLDDLYLTLLDPLSPFYFEVNNNEVHFKYTKAELNYSRIEALKLELIAHLYSMLSELQSEFDLPEGFFESSSSLEELETKNIELKNKYEELKHSFMSLSEIVDCLNRLAINPELDLIKLKCQEVLDRLFPQMLSKIDRKIQIAKQMSSFNLDELLKLQIHKRSEKLELTQKISDKKAKLEPFEADLAKKKEQIAEVNGALKEKTIALAQSLVQPAILELLKKISERNPDATACSQLVQKLSDLDSDISFTVPDISFMSGFFNRRGRIENRLPFSEKSNEIIKLLNSLLVALNENADPKKFFKETLKPHVDAVRGKDFFFDNDYIEFLFSILNFDKLEKPRNRADFNKKFKDKTYAKQLKAFILLSLADYETYELKDIGREIPAKIAEADPFVKQESADKVVIGSLEASVSKKTKTIKSLELESDYRGYEIEFLDKLIQFCKDRKNFTQLYELVETGTKEERQRNLDLLEEQLEKLNIVTDLEALIVKLAADTSVFISLADTVKTNIINFKISLNNLKKTLLADEIKQFPIPAINFENLEPISRCLQSFNEQSLELIGNNPENSDGEIELLTKTLEDKINTFSEAIDLFLQPIFDNLRAQQENAKEKKFAEIETYFSKPLIDGQIFLKILESVKNLPGFKFDEYKTKWNSFTKEYKALKDDLPEIKRKYVIKKYENTLNDYIQMRNVRFKSKDRFFGGDKIKRELFVDDLIKSLKEYGESEDHLACLAEKIENGIEEHSGIYLQPLLKRLSSEIQGLSLQVIDNSGISEKLDNLPTALSKSITALYSQTTLLHSLGGAEKQDIYKERANKLSQIVDNFVMSIDTSTEKLFISETKLNQFRKAMCYQLTSEIDLMRQEESRIGLQIFINILAGLLALIPIALRLIYTSIVHGHANLFFSGNSILDEVSKIEESTNQIIDTIGESEYVEAQAIA
ncbi:MAG: hypothetical protein LCH30_05145 [Proteobacteria bacterium]|nr:hypothetical protein [Pseudomonadota bacterium]